MSRARLLSDAEELEAVTAVGNACSDMVERLYLTTEEAKDSDVQKVIVYVELLPGKEVAWAIARTDAQNALAAALPGRWVKVLRYDERGAPDA